MMPDVKYRVHLSLFTVSFKINGLSKPKIQLGVKDINTTASINTVKNLVRCESAENSHGENEGSK